MKLNVCIVGCGARGRFHAKSWQAVEGAEITAVCDELEDRAQALAKETGAQPYTDWRRAVLHDGVNAVTQCVPSHLHADITCLAAENERHVFGEKPLALTVEQGERMLEAVRKHGVVFMPCFQRRDDATTLQYRRVFQSGAFGGPVLMRFTDIREVRPKTAMHRRSQNGGVVIDMACHLFDVMRFITGEEPQTVYATGNVYGRGKPRLAGIDDLAIDEASIETVYGGGHRLQMYLNWGMPEDYPAFGEPHWMIGPQLAMRAVQGGTEILYADHRELWPTPKAPEPPDPRIRRFAAAVRGKAEPDITAEDGLIALKCSHAALRSAETGKVVTIE